ncbi:MAG: NUDIX domain-containing protein [Candidatus Paceibacterota bacterium]|jgi:DNA polymerase/3'-5' exonuclease PolX/ADP-ribose pyrophosphatase YjhB (NUDIX family)
MSNQEISKILYEISEYLEMEDEPFRPIAYNRAARVIDLQNRSLSAIYDREGIKGLDRIPGIGQEISKKIEELLLTGRLQYLEKLKAESPVDVSTLTKIEGLGPKKIKTLYRELDIRNLDDLVKAVQSHKIRDLDGFGEKSEANILKGIDALKNQKERLPLEKVLPVARDIKQKLASLPEVKKVEIAGSIRRKKETVGDIDVLVVSDDPNKVADFFVTLPQIVDVYGKGKTKSSGRLDIGIDVDLRIVPEDSFGAALQYFTGSQVHNIKLRSLARKKGYKLSEYGLFKGNEKIAGKTEEEIYQKLGIRYIEPEKRKGENEIVITDTNIHEKSVGTVIFYKTQNKKIEYLLLHYPKGVRTKFHGHWDHVKGHVDEGESETETLIREIEEETGLIHGDLEIIDGFREDIHYNFRTERGLHYKEVIFYLVRSNTKEVHISEEHDDYKWLLYEDALETITFQGGKDILTKANAFSIKMFHDQ